MTYDVFISYRRDKGAQIARNLQQALEKLGLRVFFDMEELTDGKFNDKLYDAIEQSKNVIFLMTEGALARCVNEGDWVRKELEHAMTSGRTLVPVAPTGTEISFPEGLPEKLAPMKMLEVSELNLEKLFKESVAKIAARLKDVVLADDKERKEAEETFLNQARRFKGNDGMIDTDERKILGETAKELGINKARQLILIEKVEQEFASPATLAAPDLMPPVPTVVPRFDVFISYRRDGGAADARLMYDRLTKEGYSVSFDMDTLKNGNFNEELLRRVAECRNFIILLSPGCFDRTLKGGRREDDWMRIELATALYNKKNIIAVMLPGFEFPAKLPPDIDAVRFKNGPKYDMYYLDSFYARLQKDFLQTGDPSSNEASDTAEKEIVSVDAEEAVYDASLDEVFGDDAAYWRVEAESAYHSISRVLPYEELAKLDEAWTDAEENLKGGDHSIAARKFMEVIELCGKIKPCSIPFATRLVGDGIDTHGGQWFEAALAGAQTGDTDYQYGVGMLYADGIGVAKDPSAAFRWFERAAQQGHTQAISAVGAAYATGDGVEVDYKAAKRYLTKA
ncbi:MAG: toll/interleukin-1 receptor domain-containing protein, partial [Lentisphaeria bacterium]|nr:toll/interleukin-1 receptor domain-containing protein [Lentisphaeria bacterium]